MSYGACREDAQGTVAGDNGLSSSEMTKAHNLSDDIGEGEDGVDEGVQSEEDSKLPPLRFIVSNERAEKSNVENLAIKNTCDLPKLIHR